MAGHHPGDPLRDPAEDFVERVPVVSMAQDEIAIPAHEDEPLPGGEHPIDFVERPVVGGPPFDHRADDLAECLPQGAHPAERGVAPGPIRFERREFGIDRVVQQAVVLQPIDRIAGRLEVIDEQPALEGGGVDEVEGGIDVEVMAVVGRFRDVHVTSIKALTGYAQGATMR